jgi:AcrR family transcriptional regulator
LSRVYENLGPRRRPRADAARNRAAILEAAGQAFAARGRELSTEDVAARAGVGIGTVFRHFPTKETLLQALLETGFAQLAAEADALAVNDRGDALFLFFERLATLGAQKQVLVDALAASGVDSATLMESAAGELRAAVARLLERAQQHGVVRDDIGVTDVLALLLAVARAADQGGWDQSTQQRALTVIVDGLRRR